MDCKIAMVGTLFPGSPQRCREDGYRVLVSQGIDNELLMGGSLLLWEQNTAPNIPIANVRHLTNHLPMGGTLF
jgi:hypothetical protein